MMKWFTLTTTLVAGFAAGSAAQRTTAAASIQGTVIDANTLPEDVEYWEVRSGPGESVVISGRKNITIIQSLRQAKGRQVRLSLEAPDQAVNRY